MIEVNSLRGMAGGGSVCKRLLAYNHDIGCLRPYSLPDGRSFISIAKNERDEKGNLKYEAIPINNTEATLRKDEWIALDELVLKIARPKLKFVNAMRAAGMTKSLTNGLGKTIFQSQSLGDIGDAIISMDGLRESEKDRPHFDITSVPLPIIHKDFEFSSREIATSRNTGEGLDTTGAEMATIKVAEETEKLALGLAGNYVYGGASIQGLTNFSGSLLKTITSPTVSGWTGSTLLTELLAMRKQAYDAHHYGPFAVFVSPAWDAYLDEDFKATSDKSLRTRLKEVTGISDIITLEYMENYDIAMLEMTSTVARMIIGMEPTTIQWEEKGGLLQCFKVMTIQIPQFRADQNGSTGIVYATV